MLEELLLVECIIKYEQNSKIGFMPFFRSWFFFAPVVISNFQPRVKLAFSIQRLQKRLGLVMCKEIEKNFQQIQSQNFIQDKVIAGKISQRKLRL